MRGLDEPIGEATLYKRIAELEAEAKGGDIMAAKDAERIAELGGALGEMTTRRNLAESKVRRLEAENERLQVWIQCARDEMEDDDQARVDRYAARIKR